MVSLSLFSFLFLNYSFLFEVFKLISIFLFFALSLSQKITKGEKTKCKKLDTIVSRQLEDYNEYLHLFEKVLFFFNLQSFFFFFFHSFWVLFSLSFLSYFSFSLCLSFFLFFLLNNNSKQKQGYNPAAQYQLRFPGLVHFMLVNRTTKKVFLSFLFSFFIFSLSPINLLE